MTHPVVDRLKLVTLVSVDALTYALAVVATSTVLAVVLTVLTGGDLVRVKLVLFLIGWALVSYATFRLWPRSAADLDAKSRRSVQPGRFQRIVNALPPLRWLDSPLLRKQRLSQPGKLFLAGSLVLLASFLLETVGGVT